MIAEWSCDAEDWSDAKNSALWAHRNKLHFRIYSNRNKLLRMYNILQKNTVFPVFLNK